MRYIIFVFAHYYPGGGANDIVGRADSISEARGLQVAGE